MRHKKTCAFFGHREVSGDISQSLTDAIRQMIEIHDITEFWCGGYGAFDRQAASAVHALNRQYPAVSLVLIRAYLPKQGEVLSELYHSSLYPENLETVPPRFCISHRNIWMAQNCDTAIAYINHSFGGAYQGYYAIQKQEKFCINLGKL